VARQAPTGSQSGFGGPPSGTGKPLGTGNANFGGPPSGTGKPLGTGNASFGSPAPTGGFPSGAVPSGGFPSGVPFGIPTTFKTSARPTTTA
jgi:hypothetical protein